MLLYILQTPGLDNKVKMAKIYRRYRDLLFHTARRITGDDRDAEDAVHDTFVYLCRAIERVEEAESPRTRAFLLATVQSRAIDICRKRKKRGEVPLAEELQGEEEDRIGSVGERDALARAMESLDEEGRRILLLKYDAGLPGSEIAAIVGKSREAVYKIIQRTRVRLAEELRKEGIEVEH